MIDHTSIRVRNFNQSLLFYDETLIELGYSRIMTFDDHAAGYGKNKKPYFWIVYSDIELAPDRAVHFAFQALERRLVDAWYEKALKLGGIGNGKPGLRKRYHPTYYAAFIIDQDGWHLEAVCHN